MPNSSPTGNGALPGASMAAASTTRSTRAQGGSAAATFSASTFAGRGSTQATTGAAADGAGWDTSG